jgi:hypothetical protein
MDFSSVKKIVIPEGEVKKITDASDLVLWMAKRTAEVTIESVCNGITGNKASLSLTLEDNSTLSVFLWEGLWDTYNVPIGSTIECTVDDSKQSNRCYVRVNGVDVLNEPGTYYYTVTGDVTIHMEDKYEMGEYGMITITEGVSE